MRIYKRIEEIENGYKLEAEVCNNNVRKLEEQVNIFHRSI